METNLVIEGFKFMGLGMGTVFSFLIIMIFAMNLMAKIVTRFFPEIQVSDKVAAATAVNAQNKTKKIAAAITAAIKHHRG
ncbi:OadG family protein [Candidatus Sulfurimonas marisnigri]|uniref:Probable oxaloacetate decarboxylase gamma chain n=1 Tax=Candidatus Sulfurimonas marisnigri TaxID=2740405 RepID=A0A7S7RPP7_9BACT|nr:OadG family transporter subunit [Candidatus Sulfurimonas marisnigri]QOY53774.1 OadG family protein [Candidatus Sulfurimonas marisnigri]